MNDRNTEVLEQYDMEIFSVRRGRGSWICETDKGLRLLREYKGTTKRLEFEEEVLNVLQNSGISRVDQYVRNKEGELQSAAPDGLRYIVKEWFSEDECDIRDENEVVKAAGQIAKLHRILRGIQLKEEWNLGSILAEPMEAEFRRHNRELRKARAFISRKRGKSDFELCVIGNFAPFLEQALEAQRGLEQMAEEGKEPPHYLCHGELNQHHILMGGKEAAIIEFNRMHLGVQAADLYHFIRKVMEKHSWNPTLGMRLLEAYDRVLPMGAKERKYLYYLFLYPEKYWKQLNFYYNANKAWIPARNVEKLRSLEEQQEVRNRFLGMIRGS